MFLCIGMMTVCAPVLSHCPLKNPEQQAIALFTTLNSAQQDDSIVWCLRGFALIQFCDVLFRMVGTLRQPALTSRRKQVPMVLLISYSCSPLSPLSSQCPPFRNGKRRAGFADPYWR